MSKGDGAERTHQQSFHPSPFRRGAGGEVSGEVGGEGKVRMQIQIRGTRHQLMHPPAFAGLAMLTNRELLFPEREQ